MCAQPVRQFPARAAARRVLVVVLGALALLAAGAGPAAAHISISPAKAGPGQAALYTLGVPTEQGEADTVEVEVRLPEGFDLEAAQNVPGWETVLPTPTGARSVTWRGGRIPAGTFTAFELQGLNPSRAGALAFEVVQRHGDASSTAWAGPATSETPAPFVQLAQGFGTDGADAPAGTDGAGTDGGGTGSGQAGAGAGPGRAGAGPAATGAVPSVGGVPQAADPLARSRAAIAIALAVAALGLLLAPLALGVLRRRVLARELAPGSAAPTPATGDGPADGGPAAAGPGVSRVAPARGRPRR